MAMHPDPYDCDCLSYIKVEAVVKEYGYKHGDLLFYVDPKQTLSDGLRIISGDPDVLQMVVAHGGKQIIVIYIVSFEPAPILDPVDNVDEECKRRRLGIGTKWWDDALSSDDDLFDVNINANANVEAVACEEDMKMSSFASELGGPELAALGGHSFDIGRPSFEVGGPSGRPYDDTKTADLEAEVEGLDDLFVTPPPSPNDKDDGVEAGKDDGYMSDMIPSTLLVSPPHSDDDVAGPS